MPGTVSESPSVALSFANNFWGKDDAGVAPLLDRMHSAKVTGDELKAFYSARSSIEEEYARKLLALARKPLGSTEAGTLRMSLDVVRGETESIGKSHQNIAQQMRTELDEQLAAFHGGMKERRKIVQTCVEKLLKTKNQQTTTLNKARDKFEQDCLKIKGYLAQGHMVMGQEERKNKAKLEKTQIQVSTTSSEYQAAVKVLEETTGRWNRDWKGACDKFQDLEEERIDFMKSSLWQFANIASTVCVSDDASCEKVRLSLEECDVQKDIASFIKERGTGQEIPDPPKFIDFCRGDLDDTPSEVDSEDNYAVAQFQRPINPAFRGSSPQPSTYESHNDPEAEPLADLRHSASSQASFLGMAPRANSGPPSAAERTMPDSYQAQPMEFPDDIPEVPHNEYPTDGMTQFCRTDNLMSDQGSAVSSNRPPSRDSHSDYSSNLTDLSSQVPSIGPDSASPIKQSPRDMQGSASGDETPKRRTGLFQGRSPFRRKSRGEKDRPEVAVNAARNRNTWAPSKARNDEQPPSYANEAFNRHSASPEPMDPRASLQLNVGNNVFDVSSPSSQQKTNNLDDNLDPVAQALADLKGSSRNPPPSRFSADRFAGLATPAPGQTSSPRARPTHIPDRTRNDAPPPSYNQPQAPPVSRLGAPQPAFTSRQMQQTTQKFEAQKQSMFGGSPTQNRPTPAAQNHQSSPQRQQPDPRSAPNRPHSRATSPAPYRSTSPRPDGQGNLPRAASPNPYLNNRNGPAPNSYSRESAQSTPQKPQQQRYSGGYSPNGSYGTPSRGPSSDMPRATSPSPQYTRPHSRNGDMSMAMQLAQPPAGGGGRPRTGYDDMPQPRQAPMNGRQARPTSQYGNAGGYGDSPQATSRTRSKSLAPLPMQAPGQRPQVAQDGRPILHFARAIYMYRAAMSAELSFSKGDILAVLTHQDDGWWEAEVVGKRSGIGLVPSNYLQNC